MSHPQQNPTFSRFQPSSDCFASLEAMPSLQVPTLGKCLPHPGSTSRVVPLRHMSKLSLGGSLPEIVAVLERVSLPSSASLSLQCPDNDSPDGHSSLSSGLPFPGSKDTPLHNIHRRARLHVSHNNGLGQGRRCINPNSNYPRRPGCT